MSTQRWEALRNLFHDALDIPARERSEFLDRSCSDGALRAEVELLLAKHETSGTLLDSPPPRSEELLARLRPASLELCTGTVLAHRFHIEQFLGEGGMGQVYEARDQELGEHVALKILRPDIAHDPDRVRRFHMEVFVARKVTHPNVCRIYDFFSQAQPELMFLTMELIRGKTLAELLEKEGPLAPERARSLARQICSGLTAVHEAGLLHRDLKTSNIMIAMRQDGSERVVLMDFGLAEPAGQQADASEPLLGTQAYMAPEVLLRRPVARASDIFALGVVLFELGTGRFHSGAGGSLKISDLDAAKFPDERWRSVVRRCLAPEPLLRFQDAAVIPASLESSPLRSRRWTFAAAGGGVAVVSLFAAVLRFLNRDIEEGAIVMVTEIGNQTADPDLDAITSVLKNQLRQSTYFTVLEDDRTAATLERMAKPYAPKPDAATTREIGMREGAALWVYGTIANRGAAYELRLTLERLGDDPRTSRRTDAQTFPAAAKKDILSTVRLAANWLRSDTGEGPRDIASTDARPEELTTSSWQALRLVSQAERLKAQDKVADAILLLQEAVEKDPDFAFAYMRLGDLCISQMRSEEGLRYWQTALAKIGLRRLSQREELRIRGLYALETGDHSTADRIFHTYAVHYPNDYLAYFYRARPLLLMGRIEEAIKVLGEAQVRRPASYIMPAHLARYNLIARRFDAVRESAARLRVLGRNENADLAEAGLFFVQADYSKTEERLRRIQGSRDVAWRSRSFLLCACMAAEQARRGDAADLLERGMATDLAAGRDSDRAAKLAALGSLHLRMNDRASCRAAALQAVKLEAGPAMKLQAGILLARAGFPADAQLLAAAIEERVVTPERKLAVLRLRGEILMSEGDPARALERLEEAAKLDNPFAHREYLARARRVAGDRAGAVAEYRVIAETPERLWHQPDVDFPGAWADAVDEYLTSADEQAATRIRALYRRLRPQLL